MDYFTADFHLDHQNILKFCNRPFKDTEEMGRAIIKNVNDVVGPDDRLFHLGDVTGGRSDCYQKWISQLVCRNLFLFPGNHDKNLRALSKYFKLLEIPYGYYDYRDPKDKGYLVILHHHCLRVWPHAHHGAGHLYGHSHGKLSPMATADGKGALAFDVGVDSWDYKPLSLTQVKAEFKRLSSIQVKGLTIDDHHEVKEDYDREDSTEILHP